MLEFSIVAIIIFLPAAIICAWSVSKNGTNWESLIWFVAGIFLSILVFPLYIMTVLIRKKTSGIYILIYFSAILSGMIFLVYDFGHAIWGQGAKGLPTIIGLAVVIGTIIVLHLSDKKVAQVVRTDDRLNELDELLVREKISKEEYAKLRGNILDKMTG